MLNFCLKNLFPPAILVHPGGSSKVVRGEEKTNKIGIFVEKNRGVNLLPGRFIYNARTPRLRLGTLNRAHIDVSLVVFCEQNDLNDESRVAVLAFIDTHTPRVM